MNEHLQVTGVHLFNYFYYCLSVRIIANYTLDNVHLISNFDFVWSLFSACDSVFFSSRFFLIFSYNYQTKICGNFLCGLYERYRWFGLVHFRTLAR